METIQMEPRDVMLIRLPIRVMVLAELSEAMCELHGKDVVMMERPTGWMRFSKPAKPEETPDGR